MTAIFMLHLLLSVLFSSFIYSKDKSLNYAITALLIALALPGLGILIFLKFNFRFFNPNMEQNQDIIYGYSSRDYFKKLNILDETNVVSLEDALLISDIDQRREIMMKTLKKGDLNDFKFISRAINNDDVETSHYAASSLLNTRRALDTEMREVSRKYNENPDNMVLVKEYSNTIDRYIDIFELDPEIKEKYIGENILLLKKIIEEKVDQDPKYIIKLIELLIRVKNQKDAKKYCEILSTNYPDNEEKYLCLLKSYYEMKDKKNFEWTLQEFIDSDIVFSNSVLEIIRFWIKSPKER